ncbi:UDP-N-acetylmuramate--L-alanine ligase, partial [Francisella tularensis subsp. holarctica]|nr:UDP-N-acetylmuramate--L-alanine ligase [Francisella tularensis subsp. holarctica]
MFFLGLGLIVVSALGIAAKRLGAHVAGNDSVANKQTAKHEALGIVIFISPNRVDVANFDIDVYSS